MGRIRGRDFFGLGKHGECRSAVDIVVGCNTDQLLRII